jgi:REP element-mobilizing transposase RayT
MPGWVKCGAVFHVRLRVALDHTPSLTLPPLAKALLEAAQNYHRRQIWFCRLFLLMPDHIHALLAFPEDFAMAKVVDGWKRYAARDLGVQWQTNFFDHRIRNDHELGETWNYILRNPAAKGLCLVDSDWPWVWMP